MFIGFLRPLFLIYKKHNYIFYASKSNYTPKFRDFYSNNQDKTVHCERVATCCNMLVYANKFLKIKTFLSFLFKILAQNKLHYY